MIFNMLISEALRRENNNFDLVRLLAAMMVIFSHAYAINRVEGFVEPLYILTHLTTMAELAVKIFFFISGLVVTNSIIKSNSAIKFTISRAFRILPAYIVVILVTAIIIGPIVSSLTASNYFKNPEPYTYILNNLKLDTYYTLPGVFEHTKNRFGLNSANGSLWTIPYEIMSYSVVLLAFTITRFRLNNILSIFCILVIIEPFTPLKGVALSFSDNPSIYLLAPHFALGSLLALNQSKLKVTIYAPVVLFFAFLLLKNPDIKQLMLGFSSCLALLYICTRKLIVKIKIKNDISYGLYLWAFPIQQIYSAFFDLSIYQSQIASLATCIVVAFISFKLIEMPFMKLQSKINGRINNPLSMTNDIKSDI